MVRVHVAILCIYLFQEEYVAEGIAWTEIKYFNNAVVCQLIEEKRPQVGIMAVLDDVSASLHGVKEGADQNLKGKLRDACGQHKYYEDSGVGFKIHHYAGRYKNHGIILLF